MRAESRDFWKRPRQVRVADRMHSAAIHLLRRLRKLDSATGLGPARLSALSVVVFAGPMTLGDLAAAEQVKPPTMSRIVNGLYRQGLVKREASPQDGRRIGIRATPKGVRLLERGRSRRIHYFAERLRRLRLQDVAILERAAEIIERALRTS